MFNVGNNPEAVQQKDRVKGKKHLNSKIRIILALTMGREAQK